MKGKPDWRNISLEHRATSPQVHCRKRSLVFESKGKNENVSWKKEIIGR